MPDDNKIDDTQATGHDTKLHEAAKPQPRGNVHSEEEEDPKQDAPPPRPN